jgi:hypothetical protein
MVVVGHEAVGMAQPVITLVDVLKGVEEILTVLLGPATNSNFSGLLVD